MDVDGCCVKKHIGRRENNWWSIWFGDVVLCAPLYFIITLSCGSSSRFLCVVLWRGFVACLLPCCMLCQCSCAVVFALLPYLGVPIIVKDLVRIFVAFWLKAIWKREGQGKGHDVFIEQLDYNNWTTLLDGVVVVVVREVGVTRSIDSVCL